MNFQSNLRKYREGLGITAKDFAKQLGINYTTYANYENQGREPKYETLCKIAAALHVSIDDLLGYTPEQSVQQDKLSYWLEFATNAGFPVKKHRDNILIDVADRTGKEEDIHCLSLSPQTFIEQMEKSAFMAEKKLLPEKRKLTLRFFIRKMIKNIAGGEDIPDDTKIAWINYLFQHLAIPIEPDSIFDKPIKVYPLSRREK